MIAGLTVDEVAAELNELTAMADRIEALLPEMETLSESPEMEALSEMRREMRRRLRILEGVVEIWDAPT